MFGFKFTSFQFDGYERLYGSVVKQQVDEKLFISDRKFVLIADKRESGSEIEQKVADVLNDLVFNQPFIVRIVDAQEIEQIFVAELGNCLSFAWVQSIAFQNYWAGFVDRKSDFLR